MAPCMGCGRVFPVSRMRERITLWARSRAGRGTLTDVRWMERHSVYRCDACFFPTEDNQLSLIAAGE